MRVFKLDGRDHILLGAHIHKVLAYDRDRIVISGWGRRAMLHEIAMAIRAEKENDHDGVIKEAS